jgi:hypothetical protein
VAESVPTRSLDSGDGRDSCPGRGSHLAVCNRLLTWHLATANRLLTERDRWLHIRHWSLYSIASYGRLRGKMTVQELVPPLMGLTDESAVWHAAWALSASSSPACTHATSSSNPRP